MKEFQIVSDLHVDHYANYELLLRGDLTPVADILIIAGDLATPVMNQQQYAKFIKFLKSNWKEIIVVPGNHDYYGSKYEHCHGEMTNGFIRVDDNITFANNRVVMIGDTRVICSTLWADIPPLTQVAISKGLNDYRYIVGFTPNTGDYIHRRSVNFLKDELRKEHDGSTIVVTHHMPSYNLLSDRYRGDIISHAYASNLDALIMNYDIDVWAYGHTHSFDDRTIEGTRVVRNPYGYARHRENIDFVHDFTVSVK